MENTGITTLLRANNTVFSFKDIILLWRENNADLAKRRVNYYVKTGQLYNIRRGFYAKDKNYNRMELATKIFTPAYISFETILQKEGVVFQYYKTIFIASYLSREIECDGQSYNYKQLKPAVLTNPLGVVKKEGWYEATKERAFMDAIYLYRDYHFDNLKTINWKKCFELVSVYKDKNLKKILTTYYNVNKS